MAGLHEEDFVELSLEDIKKSCGFGLDIGGTIAKLAYRSKDDFKNGEPIKKPQKEGYGFIRLKGFPRDKVAELLDFIEQNCDVTKNKQGFVDIHSTGIGGNELGRNFEKKFNGKVKNEAEFDLFVRTFRSFAATKEKDDILLPEATEGLERAKKGWESLKEFKKGVEDHSEGSIGFNQKVEEEEEEKRQKVSNEEKKKKSMLPCLMIMCGSGCGFLKVEEDGKFGIVDGFSGCGRMFLGMGNLLTGVKDFDELMKMAAKGNGDTTDVYGRHLKLMGDKDMYSAMGDDMLIYPFGQAANRSRDDCKKEDMVFSLLIFLIMEMVHAVHLAAFQHGISQVYFCGNFVNNDMVRGLVSTNFAVRNMFEMNRKNPCNFGFIKHGGFLGAIGAYLGGNHTKPEN